MKVGNYIELNIEFMSHITPGKAYEIFKVLKHRYNYGLLEIRNDNGILIAVDEKHFKKVNIKKVAQKVMREWLEKKY